jgi:hypothetical protein
MYQQSVKEAEDALMRIKREILDHFSPLFRQGSGTRGKLVLVSYVLIRPKTCS